MLRTNRMSGFTLIELMVVIVIIGVLASLAIPRFTEASSKAKVAEAPRVLGSFESAYLAGVAEGNAVANNLIFDTAAVNASSKWFKYELTASATPAAPAPVNGDNFKATPTGQIGKVAATDWLLTTYATATDVFAHTTSGVAVDKLVPNFKD